MANTTRDDALVETILELDRFGFGPNNTKWVNVAEEEWEQIR